MTKLGRGRGTFLEKGSPSPPKTFAFIESLTDSLLVRGKEPALFAVVGDTLRRLFKVGL